jgi:hypothetical protein
MSRFAVLKPPATPPAATPTDPTPKPARQDRAGKIMVGRHFSAEKPGGKGAGRRAGDDGAGLRRSARSAAAASWEAYNGRAVIRPG